MHVMHVPKRSPIYGWHFTGRDKRLAYDDGRVVREGETLSVSGPIRPCLRGLHASRLLVDALRYWRQGNCVLWRVACHGAVVEDDSAGLLTPAKVACRHRRALWCIDVERTGILDRWVRWCALQVAPLWVTKNLPAWVVTGRGRRETRGLYFETHKEKTFLAAAARLPWLALYHAALAATRPDKVKAAANNVLTAWVYWVRRENVEEVDPVIRPEEVRPEAARLVRAVLRAERAKGRVAS